jgi:hypothetical protein
VVEDEAVPEVAIESDLPPEPIAPASVEDVRRALIAASVEVEHFYRLVDPQWGVGTFDPDDGGIEHHCDVEALASRPGTAFAVYETYVFVCDAALRRCEARDPDGGGYAFHFRREADGSTWLDTVVHYDEPVPPRAPAPVRAFVGEGDGVCDLWRALSSPGEPPRRFSVFVARPSDAAPAVAHRCGLDAAHAYRERVASRLATAPALRCTRNPSRCRFDHDGERVTVYGGEAGPTAVTITGARPTAAVERARAAFLEEAARHECP